MEYGECLALQYELRNALQRGDGAPTLLIVEHPPVATLGRRGTREEVFDANLPVYEIERGGRATYHGLGQLVLYPIVHLGAGNRDVREWVRHLESLVLEVLKNYGISGAIHPDTPGVWTPGGRKIASIGIAIQQWVSIHGIALNVDINLAEFERIDPCGLGAKVMTSLAQEGVDASMDDVRNLVAKNASTWWNSWETRPKQFA